MQIDLKQIKVYEGLSQETLAFTADLYINGRKVGQASNEGRGGNTNYNVFDQRDRPLLEAAEKYCQSLPPDISEDIVIEGKPLKIDMSLEIFIDNLIAKYMDEKELKAFQRKLEKASKTGIVYGIENEEFKTAMFKNKTIEDLLQSGNGREVLKEAIIYWVMPELHANPNFKILNKNIPKEIIDAAIKEANRQLARQAKKPFYGPSRRGNRKPGKGI